MQENPPLYSPVLATSPPFLTVQLSCSLPSSRSPTRFQRYLLKWHQAGASRRLIGAPKGTLANQRDLPRELRKKYEAVQVSPRAPPAAR